MISKFSIQIWPQCLGLLLSISCVSPWASASERQLDEWLAGVHRDQQVTPAEICSDEEFLRRVTLDLLGRIPSLGELREFQRKPNREEWIDRLLAEPRFAAFWSEVWTANLVGYVPAFDADRVVLRDWLKRALERDVPYDQIVTELLTATEASAFSGPTNFLLRYPEQPAVKVSRMFLGVRLDCARCHDHPFDRWTLDDYEKMSQFFESTSRRSIARGNLRLEDERRELERSQRPRFLTGAIPRTAQWRSELALFVTHSKPFARTFVNRVWYQLMGRGLVDPPDDFNASNPPVAPELLESLALQTRAEGFRLRPLIRKICVSQAYQRQVRADDDAGRRLFASRQLKPLLPEQIYDSLAIAFDRDVQPGQRIQFINKSVGRTLDEDFSLIWEDRDHAQAVLGRLALPTPEFKGTLEELYLRLLARQPTDEERQICRGHSIEQVCFALINSNEFLTNH